MFKNSQCPDSFSLFSSFYLQLTVNKCANKFLPMTGFELGPLVSEANYHCPTKSFLLPQLLETFIVIFPCKNFKPYFLPYGKISLEEHDSISETRFTIMKFDKKEWQGPVTATIINGLA